MVEVINLADYKKNKESSWPSEVFIPINEKKLIEAQLEIIRMTSEFLDSMPVVEKL